jgi:hypothetical protein
MSLRKFTSFEQLQWYFLIRQIRLFNSSFERKEKKNHVKQI